MESKRHGVTIGIEMLGGEVCIALKAVGRLTHEDYETITPMIDSALEAIRGPVVKVLIDGTELEGWEPRAAWDDFRLGLKHGRKFEKIAIYGNKGWEKTASKIASWFVSGEVQYFEEIDAALNWLSD